LVFFPSEPYLAGLLVFLISEVVQTLPFGLQDFYPGLFTWL